MSGAAYANLFYTTTDASYSSSSYGIVSGDFTIKPKLFAGTYSDVQAHTFNDASGKERLLVRTFTYAANDEVSIYDPEDFNTPLKQIKDQWRITNIQGVAELGDYLYIAAEVVGYAPSASGEIVKVRKSDYTVADRWRFNYTYSESDVISHLKGVVAYNGKIYVLNNPAKYSPSPSVYEYSEVYEFDPANIGAGPTRGPAKVGRNAGAMTRALGLYDNKLYVACHGAVDQGSFWTVDLDTMTPEKILDLGAMAPAGSKWLGMGIAFADDGTAFLLVDDENWQPVKLYVTTADKLTDSSLSASDKVGITADFTPGPGYLFTADYDKDNKLMWIGNGTELEARSLDGKRLKRFTPADLTDNLYGFRVIKNNLTNTPPPPPHSPDSSGGGCNAGVRSLALLFLAGAALLKTSKK
jgi:hypothetical protein